MGRHEIDLKARAGGNLPGVSQARKLGVGRAGIVGVSEIAERHVRRSLPGLEPITAPLGRTGMDSEHLVRRLESRIVAEQAFEMSDPIHALAHLAVGYPRDAVRTLH